MHGILRSHFGRDELIGRVNEIVYFLPFTEDERRRLASMELRKWAARAKSKNNIDLTWSDAAVDRAVRGYNIRYGARSIKYEIDRVLIGTVARAFEEGGSDQRIHSQRGRREGPILLAIRKVVGW